MGTWSHESFGNDDACDWAAQLAEYNDFSLVESTLDTLLGVGDDYLEAPEAWEAIAAAEVVARARGNFPAQGESSEDVDAWVERVKLKPAPALVDKACKALDRILTEPSELMELWADSDESNDWRAAVKDLKKRVSG